jgi:transcription termination/antitermination protein NusA
MLKLADILTEFKGSKNIDRPAMVRVLEDVFRTLIRKKYNSDENFDVIVNDSSGDIEIWRVRDIVPDGEVTDERSQISVSEALTLDAEYEIGGECYEQLQVDDFGRRAIQAARQTLISRIMDLEKDEIHRRYSERVGQIVNCEVNQVSKQQILVIDDGTQTELVMPRTETIKTDYFRKGDVIRCVIKKVEMKNNNPVVIVSRTDNTFLERLLENEVPEIEEGHIVIRKIVRLPGERAKVAVESFDDRIDPVGACVGMKGSRIHGIVRELRNENIDVINYTTNISLFISRALTPAKPTSITLDTINMRASVSLDADQVSLAIGKGGTNIKLASKLTGYEIDISRNKAASEEDLDDVDLEEFSDEIEQWIIEEFKKAGCDTAKSVLKLTNEELVRRVDLEEETIQEVVRILAAEFED